MVNKLVLEAKVEINKPIFANNTLKLAFDIKLAFETTKYNFLSSRIPQTYLRAQFI